MATLAKRREENAPGKYYVTDECDGCGICISYALENFMYSNDSSYYFISVQPEDPREEKDIRRVMEVYPLNCINDDGDIN